MPQRFNEDMIENLFGYNTHIEKNKGNNNKKSSSQDSSSNLVQSIDPKKAQNLSILLKALKVTANEVCDAFKEGSELPVELIQTLLKMAPTGEQELKLMLYNVDMPRLGAADRFLKILVEIPYAFRRLESLLFMCTLQEEQDVIKESFQTLEATCIQLKKSRLFRNVLYQCQYKEMMLIWFCKQLKLWLKLQLASNHLQTYAHLYMSFC